MTKTVWAGPFCVALEEPDEQAPAKRPALPATR